METGNKWFKFYGQDWLTDIKVMRLSLEDRLCYITLLCLASSSPDQGIIHCCDEESVLKLTHLYDNPNDSNNPYQKAFGCFERFEKLGMVSLCENGDVIINAFEKRQTSFLSGAERQARFREKRLNQANSNGSNVNHVTKVTLDKKRKEKKREEEKSVPDKPERHMSYLLNIPKEDIEEFKSKYEVYDQSIKGKAEDLYNYCKAKGKTYKDYKAFLSNALKKDFGLKKVVVQPVVQVEITEEERLRNMKKLAEMKKNLFKKP